MKIAQALSGVNRLAIDTAPFIYYVENNATYIDRMDIIFQRMNAGIEVFTSVITLTEVLVMPFSTGQTQFEQDYRDMLFDTEQISTIPVSAAIAEQAARLRAYYRLRTPDALQIATALELGCDAFLTNDIRLRRVNRLPILVLEELEPDQEVS